MHPTTFFGAAPLRDDTGELCFRVSDEPDLIPPPILMLREADEVLEDWFAGSAEQSTLLRALANLGATSNVLEVGCGLGRLAFGLRRLLIQGNYLGLDVAHDKIEFLRERVEPRYPRFRFEWLDVQNDFYNPSGQIAASDVCFSCIDDWADIVVMMSVLNHLLPDGLDRYLREVSRVLRVGGCFVASGFLLDNYDQARARPKRFADEQFDFRYPVSGTEEMKTSDPTCPEAMLAVQWSLVRELAERSGLHAVREPYPGTWSGSHRQCMMGQDLIILSRR